MNCKSFDRIQAGIDGIQKSTPHRQSVSNSKFPQNSGSVLKVLIDQQNANFLGLRTVISTDSGHYQNPLLSCQIPPEADIIPSTSN